MSAELLTVSTIIETGTNRQMVIAITSTQKVFKILLLTYLLFRHIVPVKIWLIALRSITMGTILCYGIRMMILWMLRTVLCTSSLAYSISCSETCWLK